MPIFAPGLRGELELLHERNGVGEFMVGLEDQDGIDAVGWEPGVIDGSKNWMNVFELLAGGAFGDVVDRLWVDVFGVYIAGGCDSSCCSNGEPP